MACLLQPNINCYHIKDQLLSYNISLIDIWNRSLVCVIYVLVFYSIYKTIYYVIIVYIKIGIGL